jgi:hypothetical protein
MPSAKASGVELGVGCGEGEVLAVGDAAGVGVTAGGVIVTGGGVGVTVDAGVAIAGCGGGGCRWHWQSKKATAPRRPALTNRREPPATISTIDLLRIPGRAESFVFLCWPRFLSRKAE